MLEIKNLTKIYNDKKVLDTISFKVDKHKVAVLLGPSGVGKSTLLRVLNNLEKIDKGEVYFENKKTDLSSINKSHLFGMIFQQFNLFEHLTVEQNITLVLKKVLKKSDAEAKNIAHRLLAYYDLTDQKDKYIYQLSGGQKQRLAIARSLSVEPKILCMDEPTSALDPLLTTYVAQNIKKLAKEGYIVLVATHDTTLLEKLDCDIYLLDNGKIVESASSDEFYKNKDLYPKIKKFVTG